MAVLRTEAWCILFFLLLCCAAVARGAEYYVDGENGSDAATGTETDPFLTVNRAVSEASGDDVIYILPALYRESVWLLAPSQQGISLKGVVEDGNYPVLSSDDAATHTIMVKNYTGTIENLEITGASAANGINLLGDDNGLTTGRIIGCRVHGNKIGIHLTTFGDTPSCNPLIRDNELYDNSTRGLGFMNRATGTAEANRIHDNGSGLIDSSGIGISGQAAPRLVNNLVYHNFNAGISIRDQAAPVILHNTITGHDVDGDVVDGTAIRVQQNQGISFLDLRNNIVAGNIYGLVSQAGEFCAGNSHNLVWGNSGADYTGFVPGPGDIAADPLLADPQAGDFHLRAGSPCIDAGVVVAGIDVDMEGDARPMGDGPDIGADEARPGVVPPDPVVEPPPPATGRSMLLHSVYLLLLR